MHRPKFFIPNSPNNYSDQETTHIGGLPDPSSWPIKLVTCQYLETQRSIQLFSPILSSDSLYLLSTHLLKHDCVSLLNNSTRYSISFSAIPNICSLSTADGISFGEAIDTFKLTANANFKTEALGFDGFDEI